MSSYYCFWINKNLIKPILDSFNKSAHFSTENDLFYFECVATAICSEFTHRNI